MISNCTNALCWGSITLFLLSIIQAIDLKSRMEMLHSTQVALHPEKAVYTYRNNDRPNTLPIRLKGTAMVVEWLDDEVYGLYADDDWKSLFPGDSGFVALGSLLTDSENEPSSRAGWSQNVFAVGMYHQLHCLDVFRHSYVAAKADALVFPGNGTGFDHHMNHCLNYMREIVKCMADTTLIHAWEQTRTAQRGRWGANSIGTVHQCRDWTQVRDFVELHKAPA